VPDIFIRFESLVEFIDKVS